MKNFFLFFLVSIGFIGSANAASSLPENAFASSEDSKGWLCKTGYYNKENESCELLPDNSWNTNTGFEGGGFQCYSGYIPKGNFCRENIDNGYWTYDGVTLICNSGYIKSENSCIEEKVKPLSAVGIDKYIEQTPNWSEEINGVIYITTRCSAILMVTGQHRIEVGDQEFGPVILEQGETLAKRSTKLALKSNLSLEVIQNRLVFWVKKYAEDSISNTDYYDNIFVGDYAGDFRFCYDLVRALNSQRQ